MSLSQVHIVPRLLRFKEKKREQTLTIENGTNHEIKFEFSAAKFEDANGRVITLFQSNIPSGQIDAKCKEKIIIQYVGSFTRKHTEKAEILQVLLDDSPHSTQTITIDCEFESDRLDNDRADAESRKSEDDLNKIVNILNLNEDDRAKKSKFASLNEILKPLRPRMRTKKLRNQNCLIFFIFFISLCILSFSIYVAFLDGYHVTFRQMVQDYGLERMVKLCLEKRELVRALFAITHNWTSSVNFYSQQCTANNQTPSRQPGN